MGWLTAKSQIIDNTHCLPKKKEDRVKCVQNDGPTHLCKRFFEIVNFFHQRLCVWIVTGEKLPDVNHEFFVCCTDLVRDNILCGFKNLRKKLQKATVTKGRSLCEGKFRLSDNTKLNSSYESHFFSGDALSIPNVHSALRMKPSYIMLLDAL